MKKDIANLNLLIVELMKEIPDQKLVKRMMTEVRLDYVQNPLDQLAVVLKCLESQKIPTKPTLTAQSKREAQA